MQNSTDYIGVFSIPDGYFGDRQLVHVLYDCESKLIMNVNKTSCFRSVFGMMVDVREAEWHIKNNPLGKKYYKNWKTGR